MKFQNKMFILLVIFCLTLSFTMLATGQEKAVRISIASHGHTDYFLLDLADYAEEMSQGVIAFDRYHNGVLGTGFDLLEQVLAGTLDAAVITTEVPQVEEKLMVFELPFIIKDANHAKRLLFGDIGKELSDLLPAKGLRVLGMGELGIRHITNKIRPIYTPEDMKGMKIRIPGGEMRSATFTAIGALPVPIPGPETYSALAQGVVDAQENPYNVTHQLKFYEVTPFISHTGHVYSVQYALMNESKWQSLDSDIQSILLSAGEKAARQTFVRNAEQADGFAKIFREEGCEFNEVDHAAFLEAVQPVYDNYRDIIGDDLIQRIIDASNK